MNPVLKNENPRGKPTETSARVVEVRPGILFQHSARDFWLILFTLPGPALTLYAATHYEELSAPVLVGMALVVAWMVEMNYQCVGHYFVHTPFFRYEFLNRLFSVWNSLTVMMPTTLFRMHHYLHHKYNNDLPDSVDGSVGDMSSLFKFSSTPGEPENFWRYSFLTPLRVDFGFLIQRVRRQKLGAQLLREFAGVFVYLGLVAYLAPWPVLAGLMAAVYLGYVHSQAGNYFGHFGGDPTDKNMNTVSAYGRIYNKLYFNNGYHHEHHHKPYVHWTRVPELAGALPPRATRHHLNGSPYGNFLWSLRGFKSVRANITQNIRNLERSI